MMYRIEDEHGFTEAMEEAKARLESKFKQHKEILGDMDFENPWGMKLARIKILNDKEFDKTLSRFLTCAYRLDCLKRAQGIAGVEDSIEVIEFSGGYSWGGNVRVFCDHDNQFVALIS